MNSTQVGMMPGNQADVGDHEREIIYVTDALCGWCYGFAPVIRRLRDEFGGKVPFRVLGGGLAIGGRAAPIGQAFAYIKSALRTVEYATGVVFGQGFIDGMLEKGTYVYDSVPPGRALASIRRIAPHLAMDFVEEMHKAIFRDGLPLDEESTYRGILSHLGQADIGRRFLELWSADASLTWAEEEFLQAKQLGVEGFPTLMLRSGKATQVLCEGFRKHESMRQVLEEALEDDQTGR